MAGSINKVTLIGNLGRDPEVRNSNFGKIVTLAVATSETWNDKQSGERKERTEWHRVVVFNEMLGNVAEKYLTKGRKVYIEGQLESRKYTDNDGNEKYTTEVVLRQFRGELQILDSRPDEGGGERDRGRGREEPRGGRDERGGGDRGRSGYGGRDDRGGGRDERGGGDRGRSGYADRDAPRGAAANGRGAAREDDRRGGGTGGVPRGGNTQSDDDLNDEIPFSKSWQ